MDTKIENIDVTENQMKRFGELNGVGKVKGSAYWPATRTLVVVSEQELSREDITHITSAVNALSDSPIPEVVSTIEQRLKAVEDKVKVIDTEVKDMKTKTEVK